MTWRIWNNRTRNTLMRTLFRHLICPASQSMRENLHTWNKLYAIPILATSFTSRPIPVYIYLRQGGNVFAGFCLFVSLSVCLSVSQQDNSKSYGRIFLKFWGHVGHGINYQWFDFGRDPAGILDSGLLWNFRYHCVTGGIREPLAKRRWWRHLANSFALAEVPAGYDCFLVYCYFHYRWISMGLPFSCNFPLPCTALPGSRRRRREYGCANEWCQVRAVTLPVRPTVPISHLYYLPSQPVWRQHIQTTTPPARRRRRRV